MGNHAVLQSAAESLGIPIAKVPDHPDWRREAERLAAAGEAILSDKEAYGVHLDHILIGNTRIKWGALGPSRGDPAGQRRHPRERRNRNPGRPSPAPTPEESRRRRRRSTNIERASPNTTPRPGKTAATPATYMKRPDNSPPRRKRTRSAGAKPKARPTSSAGFNRPRTTQRGTSA